MQIRLFKYLRLEGSYSKKQTDQSVLFNDIDVSALRYRRILTRVTFLLSFSVVTSAAPINCNSSVAVT